MSVLTPRRAQGAFVVALASIGACSDPDLATNLRPEGPPEVLSVLIMNDYDSNLLEEATFCKTGDVKRPGLVGTPDGATHQICPEDLSMGATEVQAAVPFAWYARVQFDELLNPDVEELVPILDPDTMMPTGQFTGTLENTQPVTLTCGGTAVAYSGYYNPGGNIFTWPLGPSLFIQPVDLSTVPTGSECTLAIKDLVVDKDGNKVPTDQQSGYKWKVDTLQFFGTTPAAAAPGKEPTIANTAALNIAFNAFVDGTSITAANVDIAEAACAATPCKASDCQTAGTTIAGLVTPGADGQSFNVGLMAPAAGGKWNKNKAYTVSLKDNTVVKDAAANPGSGTFGSADVSLCFLTK